MNFLPFLCIGSLAGWISYRLVPDSGYSLGIHIVIGIAVALVTGIGAEFLGVGIIAPPEQFVLAIVGLGLLGVLFSLIEREQWRERYGAKHALRSLRHARSH